MANKQHALLRPPRGVLGSSETGPARSFGLGGRARLEPRRGAGLGQHMWHEFGV